MAYEQNLLPLSEPPRSDFLKFSLKQAFNLRQTILVILRYTGYNYRLEVSGERSETMAKVEILRISKCYLFFLLLKKKIIDTVIFQPLFSF